MKTRQFALSAVLAAAGAVALATPASAATTAPPTPTQSACNKTAWEARVQGDPQVHGGQAGGVYLWHDTRGFHLRVTHVSKDRQVYRGTVTASAALRIDPVRLEGRDTLALSADHHTLSFTFYNYGHIDGAKFHTDCASTLAVTHLTRGTGALGAAHVYLGAHRVHPAHVPFAVHRKPAPVV